MLHIIVSICYCQIFWIFDILVPIQQNFIVVLLCFLLMTSDVEHHFVNLFASQKFPLVNCPFRSLTHFKIYSSWILYNYYICFVYILYQIWFANIFSLCLFFSKSVLIWIKHNLSIFFHGFCCWFISKNSSPEQMPCICYPIVYS